MELGSTPNSGGPIFRLRKRPTHVSFSDSPRGGPVQAFLTLKTPPKARNSLFSATLTKATSGGRTRHFRQPLLRSPSWTPGWCLKRNFPYLFSRRESCLSNKTCIIIDYSKITSYQTMINAGCFNHDVRFDQQIRGDERGVLEAMEQCGSFPL